MLDSIRDILYNHMYDLCTIENMRIIDKEIGEEIRKVCPVIDEYVKVEGKERFILMKVSFERIME